MFDLPVSRFENQKNPAHNKGSGAEEYGPHPCIVVSDTTWNDTNGRGVIVVPMTSVKKRNQEPTWVRVSISGQPSYALCEQIRYVDQYRWTGIDCGLIVKHEFDWIVSKLKLLGIKEF
jgi:uncharacterized protein YifN (PemK superfamily)